MPLVRSIGWSVHVRRNDKFLESWIEIRSIGRAGQQRQKQWIKPSLKPPCRGGGFPHLLHSSPPPRPSPLLFPSVIPSISSSTAQVKRFQKGGYSKTACLLAQMIHTYYTSTRLSTSLIRFLLPNSSSQNFTTTLYPSLDPSSTPYGIISPLF